MKMTIRIEINILPIPKYCCDFNGKIDLYLDKSSNYYKISYNDTVPSEFLKVILIIWFKRAMPLSVNASLTLASRSKCAIRHVIKVSI